MENSRVSSYIYLIMTLFWTV